jgi:hypothetical protein
LPEIEAEASHIPPFLEMDVDLTPQFPTFPDLDCHPANTRDSTPFPPFPATQQQDMTEAEAYHPFPAFPNGPEMQMTEAEAYTPLPAFPNTPEGESTQMAEAKVDAFPAFPDFGQLTTAKSSAGQIKPSITPIPNEVGFTHRRLGDKRQVDEQFLEVCLS